MSFFMDFSSEVVDLHSAVLPGFISQLPPCVFILVIILGELKCLVFRPSGLSLDFLLICGFIVFKFIKYIFC